VSVSRLLVPAIVALSFTSACSSQSSGRGSGGRTGTTEYPQGPQLPCESGDIDLASLTGNGVSVTPLASLAVDEPANLLGQAAYQSGPVSVCVPPDTVSMAVFGDVEQEVLISSYIGSGVGEMVDPTTLEGILQVETPDLMLPKSPDVLLHPGRHTFRIGQNFPTTFTPNVALRRGARGNASSYPLNLVLVDTCGIDSTNTQALEDGAAIFDSIYATVGIQAGPIGVGAIHDTSLAVLDDDNEDLLTQAQVESAAEAPIVPGALTFYFVREVVSDDAAGTLLGHAMGIPGIGAIAKKSGIVLSVDAHRSGLDIDFTALWVTAAHEGGHWHGLRHTTERWGTIQDLVMDTPECWTNQDFNRDGFVDFVECSNVGAKNLMFWIYDLDQPPMQLTPGQGYLLNSALTMVPQ
jgi:hypothetical protein